MWGKLEYPAPIRLRYRLRAAAFDELQAGWNRGLHKLTPEIKLI
ncbi:MAG: hypothetical protein Q4A63_07670 [Butyricicoccus pullicaecorum]|nr:hypothetical protein [Butyricicoccus pullicaecorum]